MPYKPGGLVHPPPLLLPLQPLSAPHPLRRHTPPLHRRNPVVWSNRAACFLRLGRHEKALQDAQIARMLDPKYVKVGRAGQGSARLAAERAVRAARGVERIAPTLDPKYVKVVGGANVQGVPLERWEGRMGWAA